MSLMFYTQSLCQLSLLIVAGCLFVKCSNEKPLEHTVVIAKVPPYYNDKLSQGENFWRFQCFLFPQIEIPNPIPKGLPNDDSLLFVSMDENGKLKLNSQEIPAANSLTMRLNEVFLEREKNGVYEPGERRIVKAVGIKTAHSVK